VLAGLGLGGWAASEQEPAGPQEGSFRDACAALLPTLLPALLLFLLACGDSGDQPPVTAVNSSIFTPSVQALVAESSGGGFTPQPPPGSTCLVGAQKFALTVAQRSLQYTRCEGDGRSPYHETTGTRMLSESEYQALEPLLQDLQVVKGENACITDSPVLSVTVITPRGQQRYIDAGSQCSEPDKPFLERAAIHTVLTRFSALATPQA